MSAELPLIAPQLRRLKSAKKRAGEALHKYWSLVHAAGHLALLGTMGMVALGIREADSLG
jgi:hypothetical protein